MNTQECKMCEKHEGLQLRKKGIYICFQCIREYYTPIHCKICKELLGHFDCSKTNIIIYTICTDCTEMMEESSQIKINGICEDEIIDEEIIENEDKENLKEDEILDELEDLDEEFEPSSESEEENITKKRKIVK